MKIYLVRHAQTKSNLEERACKNQKEEGLTREGEKQAKILVKKLSKIKFDKIFISEAKRSFETILPLIKLKKDILVRRDKHLNECNFGIFGGLSLKRAEKKYPGIFKKRWKDKWNIAIPRGESYKDLAFRLESFFKNLKRESKKSQLKNVLIITHATPIKVFLIKYLGFSVEKAESIYFENTSVSIFDFRNEKIKPIKINDYSHIKKSKISCEDCS